MLRRIPSVFSVVAIAVTGALVVAGCTFQPGPDKGHGKAANAQAGTSGGDTSLFKGELPPPAPLPPAVGNSKDGPTLQAAYKAIGALAPAATAGGKAAVAAWEALFLRAGIAVAGPDGAPMSANGDHGFGMPMTDGELRIAAALAASPGQVPLTEVADMLSPLIPGLTPKQLTAQLYTDIWGVDERDFRQVFQAIGPGRTRDGKVLTADQLLLSWGQVELLLRRMAAETEVYAIGQGEDFPAEAASFDGGAVTVPASFVQAGGGKRPCENRENPWSQEVLNQSQKTIATFVMDKTIEYVATQAEKVAESGSGVGGAAGKTAIILSWARPILAMLTLLGKAIMLTPSYSLADAPLVRTKGTTPGETRDLDVGFTYDPGKYQTVRECLNLMLAFAGIEIPGTQPDPPSGLEVHLLTDDPSVLRVGDGKGTSTTDVTEGTTDSNGHVKFILSGAPQIEKLPDKASPEDLTEGIRTKVYLKSNDFWTDMKSLPWDVMDAAGSGGLSLIPDLLARFSSLSYPGQVPVRDWSIDAQFQVTAIGEVTSRNAYDVSYSCGGISGTNRSTKEVGTFASDPVDVEAQLIDDPLDNRSDQAFVFVPKGSEFFLREADSSGVAMFPMPVHYSTEKTTASPGVGDMPDHTTEHLDCGNGGGGGYHAEEPRQDCGLRTYDSTLQVTIPKPHSLYVAGDRANLRDGVPYWKHCGDAIRPEDPVVAPWRTACPAPSISDGDIPNMNDILDTSKKRFTIKGTFSCRQEEPGNLQEITYNWTLDFCRLKDGKPAC